MKRLALLVIFVFGVSLPAIAGDCGLIINGDFEDPIDPNNLPFDTDYAYTAYSPSPPAPVNQNYLRDPGEITVTDDPNKAHNGWTYGPVGNGDNMLVVNASCDDDYRCDSSVVTIWQQTVPVTSNTSYTFTFDLANTYSVAPANVVASINGVDLSPPASLLSVGVFETFTYSWNSGVETEAIIALRDTTAKYSGDDFAIDNICLTADTTPVDIDIKPGSYPNCFNLNGHGVIPVAILGSADFDVTEIDTSTLVFAGLEVRVRGKKGPMCHLEDVSGDFTNPEGAPDGYLDLVCQFEDSPEYWDAGSSEAELSGALLDGTQFIGSDEICVTQEIPQ